MKAGTLKLVRDTGRAAGGAMIFSLPMLMTMEMWQIGFYVDRLRLALLVLIAIPVLMRLSHEIGFEKTRDWKDDLLDSLFAYGVAAMVSCLVLVLFGVITPDMSIDEISGKIAIQTVPAAIGALLARSEFAGSDSDDLSSKEETFGGEMFLMGLGALFLGFNVAPTEEMILISYQMTSWHAIGLIVLSLAVMHGFVFAVGFSGGSQVAEDAYWWSPILRFTLPGYAIALAISLYVLWTFGRTDSTSLEQILMAVVVLGFPSSVGAAAARLIL